MKLAICIPAFNEEKTVGQVIERIPRHIPGVSGIHVFVIDDGSTDATAEIAHKTGTKIRPDYVTVVGLKHQGLATVFLTGIHKSIAWGADVVVNIDGDGQYLAEDIPALVRPLLHGKADMVVGDRQVAGLAFMPWVKKYGNIVGSWFLRVFTGSKVRDASSGFRAYSRTVAEKLEVHAKHTYTHENLIQAHYMGLRIAQVPVTFVARPDGTSSRLITGVLKHIFKSLQGIFTAWRRWRRISRKKPL
ncbi:MAG: glycosyltransferase family 2 protein [Candidatus Gracilibacteria bacterium]